MAIRSSKSAAGSKAVPSVTRARCSRFSVEANAAKANVWPECGNWMMKVSLRGRESKSCRSCSVCTKTYTLAFRRLPILLRHHSIKVSECNRVRCDCLFMDTERGRRTSTEGTSQGELPGPGAFEFIVEQDGIAGKLGNLHLSRMNLYGFS